MSYTTTGYRHGITTEIVSIANLLRRDQTYEMVDNQRPVAWGAEEIQDTVADVDMLPEVSSAGELRDQHETHFLGPIELQPTGEFETDDGPKVIHVVDGQQRLVATTLFIACLRDKYEDLGEDEAAEDLTETFLKSRSRHGTEPTVRLTELYDDEFQQLVQDPTTAVDHDPLGELVTWIRDEIEDRVGTVDDALRLEERFLHRQVLGVYTFPQSYSRYRLSEGCNGRGVHWGPIDHIKNRMMELAEADGVDKSKVAGFWREARQHLDQVNEARAMRYWVMAYPHVPVTEKVTNAKLYATVREIMDERLDEGALTLEDYAGDLVRASGPTVTSLRRTSLGSTTTRTRR